MMWSQLISQLAFKLKIRLWFGCDSTSIPHICEEHSFWEFGILIVLFSYFPEPWLWSEISVCGGNPGVLIVSLVFWPRSCRVKREKKRNTLRERTQARSITNQVCENSCHPHLEIAVECCTWWYPQPSSSAAQNDHFLWNKIQLAQLCVSRWWSCVLGQYWTLLSGSSW